MHDDIFETFPELREAIEFHLWGIETGPMHYLENGWYWIEIASGRREPSKYQKEDPRKTFDSYMAMGLLSTDRDTFPGYDCSRSDFETWAGARLPFLLERMADVCIGRLGCSVPGAEE